MNRHTPTPRQVRDWQQIDPRHWPNLETVWTALADLAPATGLTVTEVAAVVRISRTKVTAALVQLQALGHIENVGDTERPRWVALNPADDEQGPWVR